jgi:hypothetical protein
MVKAWFVLVKEKIVDRGINEKNIYGMDEGGFPPSHQGVEHVVGCRGSKLQHKTRSTNCKNVIVLVTICADGTTLKPTIIFKGHQILKKWGDNNISEAS